ncbi:MAG: hypothetical protein L0Z62_08060 [Gemmataceae bacterium]|nr:hypothetical protein [Gemmataceae bacterium]
MHEELRKARAMLSGGITEDLVKRDAALKRTVHDLCHAHPWRVILEALVIQCAYDCADEVAVGDSKTGIAKYQSLYGKLSAAADFAQQYEL